MMSVSSGHTIGPLKQRDMPGDPRNDAGGMGRALGKVRGLGWTLADQCVVSAANFLTIYLFARNLTPADFGTFMLAYTGLLLLTGMQGALLVQPHNVLAAPLSPVQYRRFTGALMIMQVLLCAATGVAVGLAGWLVWRAWSAPAGTVLVTLAIVGVPWLAQEFVRRVLYTRRQARAAACNDIVTYGLQLAGAVALVVYSKAPAPEAALAVLGGSSLIGAFMGLWQLRPHVQFGRGTRVSLRRTWNKVWHFGKWLGGQNVLIWAGVQGHTWILALILGPERVGYYRAVTHLTNVMNLVRQAATNYLPPRGSVALHADGLAGLREWVRNTWWMLLAALLPFCAVLAGFPGSVLALAYGERYAGEELALILALSTLAQCVHFSKFPFDIGMLALRESKTIFYVQLIPAILLVTSGVALVWWLGILGVALSALLMSSMLHVATWLAYKRVAHRYRPAMS